MAQAVSVDRELCLACPLPTPVAPIMTRRDWGHLLSHLNMKIGLEIGVKQGIFSRITIMHWDTMEKYYMVDPWHHYSKHDEKGVYNDAANVGQQEQEKYMQEAINRTLPWKDKITIYRKLSTEAVHDFKDGSLDFVYLDARHDYKSVTEEMELFWPKLR